MHWQAQLLNDYVITEEAKETLMDKDLFQMRYSLNYKERNVINEKLDNEPPHCSACESKVDIAWLRKLVEEPLEHSMCLPCFLHNHTNVSQAMVDRMVRLGEENGMYKE